MLQKKIKTHEYQFSITQCKFVIKGVKEMGIKSFGMEKKPHFFDSTKYFPLLAIRLFICPQKDYSTFPFLSLGHNFH